MNLSISVDFLSLVKAFLFLNVTYVQNLVIVTVHASLIAIILFVIHCIQSMEQDHYWNNCDDDGESLSECASSVFDDDCGELYAPEPIQEKKKRPPRKKKNKQPPVPPLETTDEGTEPIENNAVPTEESVGCDQEVVVAVTVPSEANAIASDETVSAQEHFGKQTPPIESKHRDVSTDKMTGITPNTTVKTLNPNATVWGGSALPVPTPPPIATKQTAGPQSNLVQSKPTWASMAGSKDNSFNPRGEIPTVAAATPSVGSFMPPRSPASGSASNSDWRTHVVSHTRGPSPKSTAKQILIPPPPTAGQSGQMSWPTLEDFPPPPGAKPAVQKPTKPMGVWGRPP